MLRIDCLEHGPCFKNMLQVTNKLMLYVLFRVYSPEHYRSFFRSPVKTASSGVLSAISPMPLSSLAVTANSVLQKQGKAEPKQTDDVDRAVRRPTQGIPNSNHNAAEPKGKPSLLANFQNHWWLLSLFFALTFCFLPAR